MGDRRAATRATRCASADAASRRLRARSARRTGGWIREDIYAIGFDQLIPGNRSPTVNHLRLWSGRGITPFHIDAFNAGDYDAAVREQVDAKNLSRVLYPDDSTRQGKELRLKQQYFFVSASLQDILATHLSEGRTLASHARRDRRFNSTIPIRRWPFRS